MLACSPWAFTDAGRNHENFLHEAENRKHEPFRHTSSLLALYMLLQAFVIPEHLYQSSSCGSPVEERTLGRPCQKALAELLESSAVCPLDLRLPASSDLLGSQRFM